MEGKIGVIGRREKVLPFVSVGVDIFSVDDKSIEEAIKEATNGNYVVLLVEEEIMSKHRDLFTDFKDKLIPAIIPIPVGAKSERYGVERLRELLIKAIGADIVGNK